MLQGKVHFYRIPNDVDEMLTLGLDIGGVNTKAALFKDRKLERDWLEHIPLWKDWKRLEEFLGELERTARPERVGVSMTGELCDFFESKREGVKKIVKIVEDVFSGKSVYYLSTRGDLVSEEEALNSPSSISAANWVASSLLVGREYPNCLFIDVGSTTTDLIPVKNAEPSPQGWTDYERLRSKELIYTGVLRTPPSFLRPEMNLDGESVGVAFEYFANMADVYRVLGLLKEEEYTCETPDGRGKSKEECMRRIARLFCSDLEELEEELIMDASSKFREAQVRLVKEGILEVAESHGIAKGTLIVAAGVGSEILARKAAKDAGFEEFVRLSDIYGDVGSLMTPAFSLGLLVSEE